MNTLQKNITLGTAGHIDHGKTALIKLLTGCETDTLAAEKERGMSIDLGFAPCIVSNLEVGIVDVPGHENFIKTMVAGATGIDAVLFVIAADDGVMPQTREHLDILTLLGIKHGIVALTKADCVQEARVQKVTKEVRDFLKGTFLENAPVIPVSSITGQGFDVFYESLKKLVDLIEPKRTDGVFRLPVERTFSIKGYGTVVTGIPVSGSIKTGDEVILYPHNKKGRIKAIQVYKHTGETAVVGQCAAVNVPQWDYKVIKRGNTVTLDGYFSPGEWYLCKLRILPHVKIPIKNGARVKFHTGTSEITATLYLLEGSEITAGQELLIQVRLNDFVVTAPRDRFIIRSLSPVDTIGGGMIIEEIPNKLKRNKSEVINDAQDRAESVLDNKSFVEYCIKTAEYYAVTDKQISARTKILPDQTNNILDELIRQKVIFNLDSKLFIHKNVAELLQKRILEIINDYHQAKPESPGISLEQLYESSKLGKDVFDGIVSLLISKSKIIERKHRFALAGYEERFSDREQELIQKVESLYKIRLFSPPDFGELAEFTGTSSEEVSRLVRILIEQERIVRIDKDLIFHHGTVEEARRILVKYINENGGLESVKFKYLLNTTRKFAIPLLDYFDKIGLTRRKGYTRYLRTL